MLSIFGGTAAYHLDLSEFAEVGETVELDTPFGKSVPFTQLFTAHCSLLTEHWFASRHGRGALARSARFVNHRANLWGARALGCDAILSWNGVGAIHADLRVNDLVAPNDLLDFTRSRSADFGFQSMGFGSQNVERGRFDGAHRKTQTSEWRDDLVRSPFSDELRRALIEAARMADQSLISNLQLPITYVCTEGPRLETPAEIRAYRTLGADVVGMTLSPEVWLAAELGLGYASLCYVTNIAAGLGGAERNFGREVGERCLEVVLGAAALWATGNRQPATDN